MIQSVYFKGSELDIYLFISVILSQTHMASSSWRFPSGSSGSNSGQKGRLISSSIDSPRDREIELLQQEIREVE